MSSVLEALAQFAQTSPQAIALRDTQRELGYASLQQGVDTLARDLRARGSRTVALLADNGLAWAVVDLASIAAGVRLVPLPLFFSPRQLLHALDSAGVDLLIADEALPLPPEFMATHTRARLTALPTECPRLDAFTLSPASTVVLPSGTQKITYTSGTTGEPKGVCLAQSTMERVAASLAEASHATSRDVHLCALPLSTLLENIGGLYAPLLVGATTCLPRLAEVGVGGATRFDPVQLLAAVRACGASSLILVPQMLQAVVACVQAGQSLPATLRFVAVGGAPVSPRLIERARALGLPVFEGYGLSECASVVALNTVDAQRIGSVGRPLPHLSVAFADDGEILVQGDRLLGYVGDPPQAVDAPLATGDLGHLDADGYLYLSGRKKNLFVTAFGRNVAPEWVERELCEEPAIAQAAVFGEARPWNVAVILPRGSAAAVDAAIARVNAGLPDYARVQRWMPASEPFSTTNLQLTANGRLRRRELLRVYGAAIESLYEESVSS